MGGSPGSLEPEPEVGSGAPPAVTALRCPAHRITNVFYEQYLTVVPEGLFMLAMCLLPTFAVCCLLLGMDLRSGLLNLFSIIMILVDTVGFMALWGISYNAVSLINLVTVMRHTGHSASFQRPHALALACLTPLSAPRRWASPWSLCPTSPAPLPSAPGSPG